MGRREASKVFKEIMKTLSPNSWYQQLVMDTMQRFILCIAGKQGGKTTIGAIWFLNEIWTNYQKRVASGDTTPRQWLICGPSHKNLNQGALPKFNEILPKDWGEWKEQKSCFELAWGDTIFVRSADNPEDVESMTLSGAWLDEFGRMEQSVWENMQARVMTHLARVVMTTTPYLGKFWMKKMVYDRAIVKNGVVSSNPDADAEIAVIEWTTAENPAIQKHELDRIRKSMSAEAYELAYEAKFTRPHGLVYRHFDPDQDVVAPFAIPPDWERFGGLDFGFGSITCLLGVAKKPEVLDSNSKVVEEAQFFVFREFYKKGAMLSEIASVIQTMGLKYILYDPRGAQEAAELQKAYGVRNVRPADNSVDVGIERIKVLFQDRRCKVFRNCVNVIDELLSYHYKEDKGERDSDGKPEKSHDHAMDALKYAFSRIVEGLYKAVKTSVQYQMRKNVGIRNTRQDYARDMDNLTGY